MNRSLTAIVAALALAAPALAHNHAGEAAAAKPASDHGKLHHHPMNHGEAHHGAPVASMLTSSNPANGAVLQGSPATLALAFAHPVVLHTVTLVNAAGKTTKVAVPAAHTPTDRYQLKLPKLVKGAYTVNWNAGGEHAMSGRLAFQVR